MGTGVVAGLLAEPAAEGSLIGCEPDLMMATAAILLAWSETGDQKRIVTPRDAVKAGADYIVVGRPILAAPDPAEAAKKVLAEMCGQ